MISEFLLVLLLFHYFGRHIGECTWGRENMTATENAPETLSCQLLGCFSGGEDVGAAAVGRTLKMCGLGLENKSSHSTQSGRGPIRTWLCLYLFSL